MRFLLQPKRAKLVLLSVVCLATLAVSLVKLARLARADDERDTIRVADLAGPWQAALVYSNTGCGPASALVNFTLDSTGTTNSATFTFHSGVPGCGDATSSQTFTIQTLNPSGSGIAGLTCGASCGWVFNIQVDRHRSMFNMVDVDPANANNFVAGTAVRQTVDAQNVDSQ